MSIKLVGILVLGLAITFFGYGITSGMLLYWWKKRSLPYNFTAEELALHNIKAILKDCETVIYDANEMGRSYCHFKIGTGITRETLRSILSKRGFRVLDHKDLTTDVTTHVLISWGDERSVKKNRVD